MSKEFSHREVPVFPPIRPIELHTTKAPAGSLTSGQMPFVMH